MTQETGQQGHSHFPEDRDAPVIKESFFKKFYGKHRTVVDYFVFALISTATLLIVSFSIYIISVKYF